MSPDAVDLLGRKGGLSAEELQILHIELDRRRKSTAVTYFLWFFLSWAGIHKFYLGKAGEGILYLIAPWVAIVLLGLGMLMAGDSLEGAAVTVMVGTLALLAYTLWWFVDLFTIPRQVTRHNEAIEDEIIAAIEGGKRRLGPFPRPVHPE